MTQQRTVPKISSLEHPAELHIITGPKISCQNWQIEGALRMLRNVVDPEVAKDPSRLVVYGGSGKAARSWKSFQKIEETLKRLRPDETLLVQSGKPVGVFQTQESAPRVLIVNSMIVPKWANWEYFYELEQKGLIMYGQMTAGSWAFIGTQGILQGTYETLASVASTHFNGTLAGRLVLTAGLGEMGGAQPLAITMNDGVGLAVEIDQHAIDRRLKHGYVQTCADDVREAINIVEIAKKNHVPKSVALRGNIAEIMPQLVKLGVTPDIVTDQTSAHDPLSGYYPAGISKEEADRLRVENPKDYLARSFASIKMHVKAMLELQSRGSIVFEYGNNIRQQAYDAGLKEAFEIPGFVQKYIRPMFCEGRGPFRWTSLVGDPEDIRKIDDLILTTFPENQQLARWIRKARAEVKFQGLPARVCWLGYGERARFGLLINQMVARGELSGPIWIGRDHLDCGSVASPRRETEGMIDGSDAIADWPILNALLNVSAGATWVSVHQGGGVGMGYSIHAGMCIVADGTPTAAEKLKRVLTTDPGIGIVRHADAGYPIAKQVAERNDIDMPMLE